MPSPSEQDRRVRHPAAPLWWALPLALLVAIPIQVLASFMVCGISGCSGGGFGRTDDLRVPAMVAFAVSGAVVALPVWLVPWHPRRGVRLPVAAGVGVAVALLGWVWSTG